jgi:hypothetical protein
MTAQSFPEGRKGLVKYYSDYRKGGFILYEYFGVVSAFASYTTPLGARKLYSQTHFTVRNHTSWYSSVNKELSMVVVLGATASSGPGPPHSQGL